MLGITESIILALITAVSTIIAGWQTYKQHKLISDKDSEKAIIDSMSKRVEALEARQDTLYDKIYNIGQKADEERERLIKAHDDRIEQVRKEMRRLIDDSNLELATWRDKYFTLINDYQKLKLEYTALEVKFTAVQNELAELKEAYRRRISPSIGDTP